MHIYVYDVCVVIGIYIIFRYVYVHRYLGMDRLHEDL